MVKIYRAPFAAAGDKQAIPTVTDPSGFVSDPSGFTSRYELPKTDPSYLPIERAEMNGILNEITDGLGELQQFGFAKWQAGTWVKDSRCVHNAIVYRATKQTTQSPPHADWVRDFISTDSLLPTTGQSTTYPMTQKAVTDAIAGQSLGAGQAWQNMTSSRSLGTTYTNTTGRPIQIAVLYRDSGSSSGAVFEIGSLQAATADLMGGASNPYWYSVIIPAGSTYSVRGGIVSIAWWELR